MSDAFDPDQHIQSLLAGVQREMLDDSGRLLKDVTGVAGARANILDDVTIGVDRIIMRPGTAFPLHTHEGAHLLYVLSGRGGLHIDGEDYVLGEGDSIYVPAEHPHGVRGPVDDRTFEILAFGIPHHPVDSTTRMTVVDEAAAEAGEEPAP